MVTPEPILFASAGLLFRMAPTPQQWMNKINTEYLTITLQIRIRIIAPHPDPTNSSAKSGSKCITKYEDLNRLQSPPCEEMAKTEVD